MSDKSYIIEKPLPRQTKYAKIFVKLEKLICIQGKLKMCKFSLRHMCKNLCKIVAKFLRKNCVICFLLFKAFQRAKKSRSKYRFSWVKVNIGIKAVWLRTQAVALKSLLSVESEGHVLVRKVKKLNSLRPMLLSYFQKTSRVGPRNPPPPRQNRVKKPGEYRSRWAKPKDYIEWRKCMHMFILRS